jgi:microcystin-dependent protein
MAKNSIRTYSTTAASNTDAGGVDAQGTAPASNMDDLIREVMSHLAEANAGTAPVDDTWTFCDPADATKGVRLDAGAVTAGNVRVLSMPDANVTLPSGTIMVAGSYPTAVSLEGLSLVQGDVLYATAADTLTRLPKGTAAQLLAMNAGATAPEWTTPASTIPVGTVSFYGGTSAPSGWLLCYGQAISRSTYSALFTAISTTYGVGDGSTTFNLPDIRGRVIAGQDDMGGSSANRLTGVTGSLNGDTLGATGGAETHTLTEAEMPAHTHTTPTSNGAGNAGSGSGTSVASNSDGTTGIAGSGDAHNNVQPTIILNAIIYAGV